MSGTAISPNSTERKLDSSQSIQTWLRDLTPDSTVGELPAFEATVGPDIQTASVDKELGASPDLPGVVVAAGGELLGMISRPRLLAQLSRPFGQELYLKRPIQLLLDQERGHPLVLSSDLLVRDAAHAALQRPADSVYEPVVVKVVTEENQFRLLDVYTLLVAQSRLLALANATIRSQADVADAANRAKSLFLANMSHEIRTPLTAILGFAENLMDLQIPDDERFAAIRTILRNGNHLLQLINDILDLSKIEAGRLETEILRFSPGDLAKDVLSALRVRSDAKLIGLTLTYDGPIPDSIESDPTRLRQVLMNLVSNAIKFTERGQVAVRMKMLDANGQVCAALSANQAIRLQCDVIDSGIGMSEEQVGRLFSPFMQADESTSRRYGGTGLGLWISRRLANLLGGDIRVTSKPGVGSRFSLQVSAGHVSDTNWHDRPSAIAKPQIPDIRSMDMKISGRLLLAEDGPDNQLLIGSFLRKSGADVTIVDNGRKAVDAAMESLNGASPFNIILMDMQMPVLDGYSATSELRSRGWKRPILALTANVMQGDRQKCLGAGCDDFATKPINRSQLIDQILALTNIQSKLEGADTSTNLVTETPAIGSVAFDVDAALEQVGGDHDLLRQITAMFVQISPEWLNNLQRHLQERDQASARRVAHSLKNSAENVGGRSVGAAMVELEEAIAHGSLDEAISIWPECRSKYHRLLEAVESYQRIDNSSAEGSRFSK